jgi:hypothetical protein
MLNTNDNTKKTVIPEQFKKNINNHINSNSLPNFISLDSRYPIVVIKKAVCEYGDYCINQFDTCVWRHKDQSKVYDDVRESCRNGDSCIYKTKVCQKNHNSKLPPYIKTPKCKKGDNCILFKENKCYLIHPKQIKDFELFSMTHSLKETEDFVESIKINTFINNMEFRKSQKYKFNNNSLPLPSSLPTISSSLPTISSSLPTISSSLPPLHSSLPPLYSSLPPLPSPPPPPPNFYLPLNLTSNSNTLPPNFISDLLKKSITYDRGRSRSRSRDHEREYRHRHNRSLEREHRRSRKRSRSRSRDRSRRHDSKY